GRGSREEGVSGGGEGAREGVGALPGGGVGGQAGPPDQPGRRRSRGVQAEEADQRGARRDLAGEGRVSREGRGRDQDLMAALDGKELILGVTGSIAAYKAVYLLRELIALGARATVCLPDPAREFVGPLTFRTLSGRPVLTNLFDPQSVDAVEHVALAER